MTDPSPVVGVLAASPSELPIMRQTGLILEKFDVPHEVRIMSSSRNPDLVDEYARTAFERGLKVVVCSTGLSGQDRKSTRLNSSHTVISYAVFCLKKKKKKKKRSISKTMK